MMTTPLSYSNQGQIFFKEKNYTQLKSTSAPFLHLEDNHYILVYVIFTYILYLSTYIHINTQYLFMVLNFK